ncbi:MAG: trigger factor [Chloroflexi bacterium]|nr:trigger factor [Chloroflexota bacterium]
MVKVSTERLANSQVALDIEVEPEAVAQSMERAYRRLAERVNVPGFRKGKAPRTVLERYVGKDTLWQQTVDLLLPQVYTEAIKEQGIDAIGEPQVEVKQREPVVFRAIVPVRPTVELGDYKSIRFEQEVVTVEETEVDSYLRGLQNVYATWEPAERPVAMGDLLTLDVEGYVEGEKALQEKGMQYPMVEDGKAIAPGFAEGLVGAEKEQPREVSVTLPSDYHQPELAGKECRYQVVVKEIKERHMSPLDDDFARSLNSTYQTLEELRQGAREDLRKRKAAIAEERLREKVIQAVVDMSSVEFPPLLLDQQVASMIDEANQRIKNGWMTTKDMELTRKSPEEVKEALMEEATQRVRRGLVLGKVAEVEEVVVTEEDLEAEIERLVKGAEDKEKAGLSSPAARRSVERILKTQKTVRRLVEIATDKREESAEGSGEAGESGLSYSAPEPEGEKAE